MSEGTKPKTSKTRKSRAKKTAKVTNTITDRFIRAACARLAENKRVRRSLPMWGRLHVDRLIPFICLYRRPLIGSDVGTDKLVTGEASYVTAPGVRRYQDGLTKLISGIGQVVGEEFGAFLVLEVWARSPAQGDASAAESVQAPGFRIHVPHETRLEKVIDTFSTALSHIQISGHEATVRIARSNRLGPKGRADVLKAVAADPRCFVMGLEVTPIYRHATEDELYPLLLREFRRGVSRALRPTLFEFVQEHSTNRPSHFHVLGRRAVVKAVWEVDRQLAEVADSFDFLLQVTPVNGEQAWREFQKDRFERAPAFRYRPLPIDPVILKRRLYEPPIERIEDPALLMVFREKQDELDRQITMLLDLNTDRFLHGSQQLYGSLSPELVRLAEQILEQLPPRTRDDSRKGYLDAGAFAELAEAEVAHYREQWPEVTAQVQIRTDIGRALMVSSGSLLIGDQLRIPVLRAEALIAHEVGTHVLTYFNGLAQPFRQLHTGLAGYDSLQEGIAVLSEYLVGGLSRPRLRVLAARVLVVRDLIDGASFVEAFRRLYHNYGFERQTAFTVARRVYRGGGLTKDASYLFGLNEVLQYLQRGGEIAPLYLGKVAMDHIPVVRELQWRGVLRDPPLTPRYLAKEDALSRLERLRKDTSVLDLIKGTYK